jgi:hypothetical protein
MLQLTPQSRIFVALEPVDFRKGIDGLGGLCRRALAQNPLDGAIYVFRNRAATGLKILCYDGQGFWLCTKRLSKGRLQWWPRAASPPPRRAARGRPIQRGDCGAEQAAMAEDWRRVA